MISFDSIRRLAGQGLGPMIGAAAVAYFAFHMVQGDRGLLAWWQLRQEITKAEAVHQTVAARKKDLENRVALMQPQALDRDILEERARVMLNMGYPGERVILLPPSTSSRDAAPDGAGKPIR